MRIIASLKGLLQLLPPSAFSKKPLQLLLDEMKGEHRLRRVLGPVQLASLGVGAIIGTGIFVLVGEAAHDRTGPALMLSFVVSGMACIFAALCYAEFACTAVLIMRKTNPDAERPFRAPFGPVIPILGILTRLLLMFSLPAENWYRLFVWLGI